MRGIKRWQKREFSRVFANQFSRISFFTNLLEFFKVFGYLKKKIGHDSSLYSRKSFNFGACDVDYSINTFYFILCRSRKSCPFAYGWRLKVELSWQSHRRPSPSGLNFWDLAVTLTRSWRTLARPETKKQSNIIHQLIP